MSSAPTDIEVHSVPLEDGLDDDPEFVDWMRTGVLGTPLYYSRYLERWPDRCAAALAAIAEAPPGGVVFHCVKGSDRTGMIAACLLRLLDVPVDQIVADYLLTAVRLKSPVARQLAVPDDHDALVRILEERGSSFEDALRGFVDGLRLDTLVEAGLSAAHHEALRRRALSD